MTGFAVVLITLAVALLLVLPITGAILFRPGRAMAVKHAEATEVAVAQRITELAIYHPEITRKVRIDRHPFYLIPHVAVWGYSVCVFLGAPLTSNVISLSPQTRYTMGVCLIIGASLILIGAMMGGRVGRWRLAPLVHNHPTALLLGDDVGLPYRLGMAGLLCMTVSSAIYSWTSFQSTAGSLGGWLSGALAVASPVFLWVLAGGVRDFDRDERILLDEVRMRIERDGAHDVD